MAKPNRALVEGLDMSERWEVMARCKGPVYSDDARQGEPIIFDLQQPQQASEVSGQTVEGLAAEPHGKVPEGLRRVDIEVPEDDKLTWDYLLDTHPKFVSLYQYRMMTWTDSAADAEKIRSEVVDGITVERLWRMGLPTEVFVKVITYDRADDRAWLDDEYNRIPQDALRDNNTNAYERRLKSLRKHLKDGDRLTAEISQTIDDQLEIWRGDLTIRADTASAIRFSEQQSAVTDHRVRTPPPPTQPTGVELFRDRLVYSVLAGKLAIDRALEIADEIATTHIDNPDEAVRHTIAELEDGITDENELGVRAVIRKLRIARLSPQELAAS